MQMNYKKISIVILVIISMIVVYKIPRLLINRNNKPLPEVKLKETNNKKSFAIMIQNESGYEEYNKDTWPTDSYKFKEAKCIDNNGTLVDKAITYNNEKVTLTTNQTIYCTLYFDKKLGISALDIVASKPKSLSPNPDQGDMYRYQGTSELVNDNYICFGTSDKATCTSDEDHYMYRILGITPSGEMKLIKQTPIKEGDNVVFSWYKATGTDAGGSTLFGTAENGFETWPESAIYKRLNGLSNGTIQGTGQNVSVFGTNNNVNSDTNIFVDSYKNEYPYMKKTSDWYKLIADHDWMYGDSTEETYDGHKMYQIETCQIETKCTTYTSNNGYNYNDICKCNKNNDKVPAKIGLLYVHDILLSYYDGVNENTRGIPSQSNFGYWIGKLIKTTASSALINRCSFDSPNAGFPTTYPTLKVFKASEILITCDASTTLTYNRGLEIHPTFYLSNTIEMEGTGIETDPYRIIN